MSAGEHRGCPRLPGPRESRYHRANTWGSLIMKRGLATITCAIAFVLAVSASSAQTLATVKARGILTCGVHLGLAGFGIPDKQGNWSGFDVDFCRAIAAAIF